MKRFFLVLLAMLLVLSVFTACDDDSDGGSSSGSSSYTTIEVSTEEELAEAVGSSRVIVQLLDDIGLTEAVTVTGTDVILDLNGKTITCSVYGHNAITIKGSLTITGDGTIENKSTAKYHVICVYGGTLTIESGTIIDTYSSSTSSYCIIYGYIGSIIIKGGTFTSTWRGILLSTSSGTVVIEDGTFGNDITLCGSTTIKGGKFSGDTYLKSCSAVITGGKFSYLQLGNCEGLKEDSAVEISGVTASNISFFSDTLATISDSTCTSCIYVGYGSGAIVTIESGSYKKVIVNNGFVTINGGEFSYEYGLFTLIGTSYSEKAEIDIYGGTFDGVFEYDDYSRVGDYTYFKLYGGTFNDNPKYYLSRTGYSYTTSTDASGTTWYTVVE